MGDKMISKITLQNIEALTEIDDQVYEEIIFFTVKKLIAAKRTITAAESLTAGMFQSAIADVSGASGVFNGGFVTYSNEAKEQLLGIPEDIVNGFGVVSGEVAEKMAEFSKKKMAVDIGISLTGVAGPNELEGKPAGTVFIGISNSNETKAYKFLFKGNRKLVRRKAVISAFLIVNSYF